MQLFFSLPSSPFFSSPVHNFFNILTATNPFPKLTILDFSSLWSCLSTPLLSSYLLSFLLFCWFWLLVIVCWRSLQVHKYFEIWIWSPGWLLRSGPVLCKLSRFNRPSSPSFWHWNLFRRSLDRGLSFKTSSSNF